MKRWTTGEVSKEHAVSVRTLRYYDQIGLLKPSCKQDNGRRHYSEEDLLTLEKILLLKSLALSLDDIRLMIDRLSFRDILIAHHQHLQDQLATLETSIQNTSSLINLYDLEGSLSWERVSKLVNSSKAVKKKWVDYFAEDEKQFLKKNLPNLGDSGKQTQLYLSLLRRMEWCISRGIPPESDAGMEIGHQLLKAARETFGEDEELMEKFWEVRKKPSKESGLYPVSEDVLLFAEKSMEYAAVSDVNSGR
ncbi:MerR family transcriptional regulator [Metabacillus indicus]|uniref:MerR family transcriptional regulator n=1 Tax=Metabacillus indicus TaxID=246786 RepID=UPI002491431D|nr:MerR family transcriptional regulator [Metabacillus indicus]